MPRRHILTERQRHTLLELPTDEPSLLEHYTLAEDDLEHIRHRRRPHNRLGFALQLCALRYPGRLLSPGEVIPHEVLRFLARQLVLQADDLLAYASREETRHEHLAILRRIYGYKTFTGRGVRALKSWLAGQAELARSNEDLRPPGSARSRPGREAAKRTLDGEDRSGIMRGEGEKRSAPLLQDFNRYPNPLWIGLW